MKSEKIVIDVEKLAISIDECMDKLSTKETREVYIKKEDNIEAVMLEINYYECLRENADIYEDLMKNNEQDADVDFSFKNFMLTLILILGIIFFIGFLYKENSNRTERLNTNKKVINFQKGEKFICQEHTDNVYFISKKRDWQVNKHYFLKDDLYIDINRCREIE
ncbi:MAG: hypothetical protein J7L21_07495 [Sulfurimonas sp.]|nr:hypothetical protein [Sulfurimonas sp.]